MKSRSRIAHVVSIGALALAALVGAGRPAEACQYVEVLDECRNFVYVYEAGGTEVVQRVDLSDGGSHRLTGVVFSTIPGLTDRVAFVTQGRYVRALHHPLTGDAYVHTTRDLESAAAVPGFRATAIAAARPLVVDGGAVQHALYVVGNAQGIPYYVVIVQGALLQDLPAADVVLAAGQLCTSPGCMGAAVAVAVGSTAPDGAAEEAYASVWATVGSMRKQRFYRLARPASAQGPFALSLDAANEGVRFTGTSHRRLGVAFDPAAQLPIGVFQSEKKLGNLRTGQKTCALGGEPTDVALWNPMDGSAMAPQQLVVYQSATGGLLSMAAAMSCAGPFGNGGSTVPTAYRPVALALSSPSAAPFWAYTLGFTGAPVAHRFDRVVDAFGDRLVHATTLVPDKSRFSMDDGCLVDVAIGSPVEAPDVCPEPTCGDCPASPIPCCLDPDDPAPDCDRLCVIPPIIPREPLF